MKTKDKEGKKSAFRDVEKADKGRQIAFKGAKTRLESQQLTFKQKQKRQWNNSSRH